MPTHPNAWQITLWNQICRVPLCLSPFHQNMGRNIIQISSRHSWLWVRSILTLSERREAILAGSYGPELRFILARKSLISSHESLRIKREGEPWHTGPKSFPNYFYIDKETFRMVWLTSWVRKNVGWWERFCASVQDSDELQWTSTLKAIQGGFICITLPHKVSGKVLQNQLINFCWQKNVRNDF